MWYFEWHFKCPKCNNEDKNKFDHNDPVSSLPVCMECNNILDNKDCYNEIRSNP